MYSVEIPAIDKPSLPTGNCIICGCITEYAWWDTKTSWNWEKNYCCAHHLRKEFEAVLKRREVRYLTDEWDF